jgi:hypothetical protein
VGGKKIQKFYWHKLVVSIHYFLNYNSFAFLHFPSGCNHNDIWRSSGFPWHVSYLTSLTVFDKIHSKCRELLFWHHSVSRLLLESSFISLICLLPDSPLPKGFLLNQDLFLRLYIRTSVYVYIYTHVYMHSSHTFAELHLSITVIL